MKKILSTSLVMLVICFSSYSQVYMAKSGEVSFFSKTPIRDIDAHNTSVQSMLNTATKDVVFIIPVTGFKFKDALMQEHFNEKYMESEKYPKATFKGKINEQINFAKDTTMTVSVTGKLNVHNVEKDRTVRALVTIKNGQISAKADFNLLLKDHNVEIPKVVTEDIAESVAVHAEIVYAPYQKK